MADQTFGFKTREEAEAARAVYNKLAANPKRGGAGGLMMGMLARRFGAPGPAGAKGPPQPGPMQPGPTPTDYAPPPTNVRPTRTMFSDEWRRLADEERRRGGLAA
jgi:hypothetical protein